ncbi:hypothetical protein K8942_03425 [Candidatus Peribacteria bacterium]|nr:MAG: hypothetical protein K8942_03425 [Candidatus Peribacteria bacterium]
MKKFTALSLLTASLLTAAPLALAANGSQTFITSIGSDRYVGGNEISVNQPVTGDLIVGGGTVTVNAPVTGSVQAMGGTVILGNTVGGNVRVFGGTVVIMKNVRGNILVGGGNVRIQQGVEVGGSVLSLAGETTIDGNVSGTLKIRGGSAVLHGIIRGDADVQSDSIDVTGQMLGNTIIAARTLTTASTTLFNKNLTYWLPTGEQDFGSMVRGTATFDPAFAMNDKPETEKGLGILAAFITAITIYSVLSGALMIGLFVLLTKTFFKDSAKVLKSKPGVSFLTGLLYFLLTPIATVLLLITVIGLPIAIAVALLFALSLLFAKAVTAMVFARYIEAQYKKKWNNWMIFGISLGIFLALKIVGILPIVGWIVTTVAVLIGYGAVLRVKYERYKKIM